MSEKLLSRRNPLTPEMERQKREELKRYDEFAKPDQVYGLYTLKDEVKRYFYVGIALNPKNRWAQNQRVARNHVNTLPEYEHMRFVKVENCFMEVLDPTGEFTEAEWIAMLREQGHELLNVAGGVDVKRKKRTTYKHNDLLAGIAPGQVKHSQAFLDLMSRKNPIVTSSG